MMARSLPLISRIIDKAIVIIAKTNRTSNCLLVESTNDSGMEIALPTVIAIQNRVEPSIDCSGVMF